MYGLIHPLLYLFSCPSPNQGSVKLQVSTSWQEDYKVSCSLFQQQQSAVFIVYYR